MNALDPTSHHLGAARRNGERLLRVIVALVLLGTALGKSLDLTGFAAVVGTYQVLPEWSWYPAGLGLTLTEWVVGGWLLLGRRVQHAALAAAALHTMFTGWASLALVRGLEIPNCGCFGVFYARPLTLSTIYEDVVMLILCLTVYGLARGHQSKPQVTRAPGPAKGGAAKL